MKRKTKNIIATIILLLTIIATIFTVYIASNKDYQSNIAAPNNHLNEPPNREVGEEPPAKPSDNDFGKEKPEAESPDNGFRPDSPPDDKMPERPDMEPIDSRFSNPKIKKLYYVIFAFESLIIVSTVSYLLMSHFNKLTLKESFDNNKLIIFILINLLLVPASTIGLGAISNHFIPSLSYPEESDTENKDEVDINQNNVVADSNINLNNYNSDITINKSGTYTLTGSFNHSIIVAAKENDEVDLVLNEVTITNEKTATIIGLSGKSLTITSKNNSINKLKDGGNSTYDGCIFSNIPLIFDGKGTLHVTGNQNEGEGIATEAQDLTFNDGTYYITSNDDGLNAGGDGAAITINGGTFYIDANGDGIDSNKNAIINGGQIFVIGSDTGGNAGIDTDDGYTINGGLVVALGSDMIENPNNSSKQKSLSFTLENPIAKDTTITLTAAKQSIVSFIAPKSFKTIIISSKDIINGSYELYQNKVSNDNQEYGITSSNKVAGDKITINNEDTFKVTATINQFGHTK